MAARRQRASSEARPRPPGRVRAGRPSPAGSGLSRRVEADGGPAAPVDATVPASRDLETGAFAPPAEASATSGPPLAPATDDHGLPVREPLRLDPALPLREALAASFAAELQHAMAVAGVGAERPALAVHAFRRSLRRARSLVRLLRDVLPRATWTALSKTLSDIGRGTSELRDAEVLPAALRAVGGKNKKKFAALDADLRARRDAARLSPTAGTVLQASIAALMPLPAVFAAGLRRDLTWKHVADGLRDSYERARDARTVARKRPRPELIHDWRKRCKDLRHQLELLGGDEQRLPRGRLDGVVGLTRDLGQVTDLIALQKWARATLPDDEIRRALLKKSRATMADRFEAALVQADEVFADKPKRYARTIAAAAQAPVPLPTDAAPTAQDVAPVPST